MAPSMSAATETLESLAACPCPFPLLSNKSSSCQFDSNLYSLLFRVSEYHLGHRNNLQAYAIDSNLPLQRVTMVIFLINKSDGVSLQFRIFNDSPITSVIKTKSGKYKTHSLGLKSCLLLHCSPSFLIVHNELSVASFFIKQIWLHQVIVAACRLQSAGPIVSARKLSSAACGILVL